MPITQRFLTHRETLPQSRTENWGQERFVLPLAGRNYLFKGLQASQRVSLDRVHGWRHRLAKDPGDMSRTFAIDGTVETKLQRSRHLHFRSAEEVDWDTVIELDSAPGVLEAASYRWLAKIEWGEKDLRGTLWTDLPDGEAFTNLVENYARLLIAYDLLRRGGLLVHSAAISDGSGAWLFPGASGNGKSTLSRLALEEGKMLLSDDSNALFPTASGPCLTALPFGGEFLHRQQPVAAFEALGLASLVKGSEHHATLLSKAEAVALLISCAPFVNGDPHCQDALFANAQSLVHHLALDPKQGLWRLTFAKRGGFWNVLEPAAQARRNEMESSNSRINPSRVQVERAV